MTRVTGRILVVASVAAVAVQFFGLYRAGGPPEAGLFPGVDKVQHLLGFAVPLLLVLTARWWPRRRQSAGAGAGDRVGVGVRVGVAGGFGVGRQFALVVTVLFLAQALVSEVVQGLFLPMRSGDPLDAVADSLGIVLGWAGFAGVTRVLEGRRG